VLGPLLLLIGEPHVINLQERVPLMLVVSTPTGQVADISKSELIRIVGDLVKRHTDFFTQELDDQVVEDCQGRLTCLALKSRRDEASQQPHHLLFLTNIPIPDGADRLSLMLIDLEAALAIHDRATKKPGWKDEVEATISEQAVIVPLIKSEVRDPQEAATFLAIAFTRNIADKLEPAGHWEPYGDIEIDCELDGASIKLDGANLGTTVKGITEIKGAHPGKRTLELEHPGHLPFRTEIEVVRKRVTKADADLIVAPTNTVGVVRQVVLWTGVAAAAAGAAIGIAAIATQGDAETSCFAPCDTGKEFETFGHDDANAGRTDPINPGGVAVGPLGLALAGTGLVWSLGTWLLGSDDDIPWIQLAVGVAVGGATYAFSVLLDHSTPEVE
jgi:hypothetical protein